VLAKQQELEDLKRDLTKAGEEETFVNNLHDHTEDVMTTTDGDLNGLQEEHDFEKLQNAQYKHVKSRIQKDLIASQLKSQELQESLKSKQEIFDAEDDKLRKTKQARNQANQRLR
jgi:hypothetical protein